MPPQAVDDSTNDLLTNAINVAREVQNLRTNEKHLQDKLSLLEYERRKIFEIIQSAADPSPPTPIVEFQSIDERLAMVRDILANIGSDQALQIKYEDLKLRTMELEAQSHAFANIASQVTYSLSPFINVPPPQEPESVPSVSQGDQQGDQKPPRVTFMRKRTISTAMEDDPEYDDDASPNLDSKDSMYGARPSPGKRQARTCPYPNCNKSVQNLEHHIQYTHRRDEQKKHECPNCEYSSIYPGNLRTHLASKTGCERHKRRVVEPQKIDSPSSTRSAEPGDDGLAPHDVPTTPQSSSPKTPAAADAHQQTLPPESINSPSNATASMRALSSEIPSWN
ncbi:hypothetical protein DL96DRAFT_1576535, partial [Flagelloscypha sp. PMI_526]